MIVLGHGRKQKAKMKRCWMAFFCVCLKRFYHVKVVPNSLKRMS